MFSTATSQTHVLMTKEEQKTIIKRYLKAYKSFDIDGMIGLVHPNIVFKNIAVGAVNAEAIGAEQFREMAVQSKAVFSSRHQRAFEIRFSQDVVIVDIAYEGVVAIDISDSLKAGDTIRINGRSEFAFKDGKIYRMTDFS